MIPSRDGDLCVSEKILQRLGPGGQFNLGLFNKDKKSFQSQGIGKFQVIKLHVSEQPKKRFINVGAETIDLDRRKNNMACFEEHG